MIGVHTTLRVTAILGYIAVMVSLKGTTEASADNYESNAALVEIERTILSHAQAVVDGVRTPNPDFEFIDNTIAALELERRKLGTTKVDPNGLTPRQQLSAEDAIARLDASATNFYNAVMHYLLISTDAREGPCSSLAYSTNPPSRCYLWALPLLEQLGLSETVAKVQGWADQEGRSEEARVALVNMVVAHSRMQVVSSGLSLVLPQLKTILTSPSSPN